MPVRAVRSLTVVAATAIVGLAVGSTAAGSSTTEPPAGSAATAPGCAEIGALLDTTVAMGNALVNEDAAALAASLAELGDVVDAAAAAAPAEIAAEIETLVATAEATVSSLEGVDLGDVEAVVAALEATQDEATAAAFTAIGEWAVENCGYAAPGTESLGEVAEPADCESLDAAAAAAAAGIDVNVSDLDGSADVNLPGLWTKSCSYGNGAMSLSTLSFAAVEDAKQFYADNLDAANGVVLDVPLGSLPASSLVIATGSAAGAGSSVPSTEAATTPPTVQVAVFEAPVPFSVTFTGAGVDPAAVVAAAEAVLAALGTEAPVSTAAAAPTTS
jgi:hypothetical protein